MKKFILLKDGNYTPNIFVDMMEAFNNYDGHDELHNLIRTEVSVLLHGFEDRTRPIALSHFSIDPHDPPLDSNFYKPINIDTLMQAADQYGTAILATITPPGGALGDNHIINDSIIVVRDGDNNLIDYETQTRIPSDNGVINSVTFLSLLKLKGLPVYYLITDSKLLKLGDGLDLDFGDLTLWHSTDYDGILTDFVFMPSVNDDNMLINDNIFVTTDTVEIGLFEHSYSLFGANKMSDQLDDITLNVTSNFNFEIKNNVIFVDVTSDVGYITITPDLGSFSNKAKIEKPDFKFSIFRINSKET